MTRTAYIASIKAESRITSSDLDTLIGDIINQKLDDMARIYDYKELIVRDESLTVVDETGAYDAPDDFLRLLQVYFSHDEEHWIPMDPLPTGRYAAAYGGHQKPVWFEYEAGKIKVYPYVGLLASDDFLKVDYIQKPSALFADGDDEFPVPSIAEEVRLEIIARLHLYDNSTAATAYHRLAKGELAGDVGVAE